MFAHEDPGYSRCEFAEDTILSGSVVPDSSESEGRLTRIGMIASISPGGQDGDVD